MREVKKMWFVIDTKKDWSQQWINGFDTEEEARKSAQTQWDYLTDREKKERFIQVAEMDAVYDEYRDSYLFPISDEDEEFEEGMTYLVAYNPVLTLQVEE